MQKLSILIGQNVAVQQPPRRLLATLLALALLMGTGAAAQAAAPLVTADHLTLLPNTPGQVIQLSVAGTDTIWGEDLYFQINDGLTGPTITDLDIITGTIFASSNSGQNYSADPAINARGLYATAPYDYHMAMATTTTLGSDTTTANGLLATLTISTVGFNDSTFQINMVDTFDGTSDVVTTGMSMVDLTFPSNTFSIVVPEPATGLLLLTGTLLLARRRHHA